MGDGDAGTAPRSDGEPRAVRMRVPGAPATRATGGA